jgi:hypothetical protein
VKPLWRSTLGGDIQQKEKEAGKNKPVESGHGSTLRRWRTGCLPGRR